MAAEPDPDGRAARTRLLRLMDEAGIPAHEAQAMLEAQDAARALGLHTAARVRALLDELDREPQGPADPPAR